MKCPHCGYEDTCAGKCCTQGEHGDFFKGPVLTREHPQYPTLSETVRVYGCPVCTKTFIGEGHY